MPIVIAPPGFERFFILDSPLRVVEEHAAAPPPDLRSLEPAAAVQSTGLQLALHAMAHRSRSASSAAASRREAGTDRPLFSDSPGEIGGSAVAVATRLSAADWARLDASAAPRPAETAHRYAPAAMVRGTTVSVTA